MRIFPKVAIAVLGLSAALAVGLLFRPVSLFDYAEEEASRCRDAALNCSWGLESWGLSRSDYLRLSPDQRSMLVAEKRRMMSDLCSRDEVHLLDYRRIKEKFDIFLACSNTDEKFVTLIRGSDLYHWDSTEQSAAGTSLFPSVKVFWNWCKVSECPSDPGQLFFVEAGG